MSDILAKETITTTDFGIVSRIATPELAYVVTTKGHTLSFAPLNVEQSGNSSIAWVSLEGRRVIVNWIYPEIVVNLKLLPEITHERERSGIQEEQIRVGFPLHPKSPLELHPDRDPKGEIKSSRALPLLTRKFGKLLDTTILQPGDLVLTRELKPDRISQLITEVQIKGGYPAESAHWTHAAMYVGDGLSLVEATFDSLTSGGDVRITALDEYCQGTHSLRFRRSKFIRNEQEGWKVCVRALSRLKREYNFFYAVQMWYSIVFKGQGFFSNGLQRSATSTAVICSTLYADAYNESTRRSLGEVNGTCVPAWLSLSDEFEDLQGEWLKIL